MVRVAAVARSLIRNDEGATMPEYALMVAFIALVCVAAVTLIGTNSNGQFNNIATAIGGA